MTFRNLALVSFGVFVLSILLSVILPPEVWEGGRLFLGGFVSWTLWSLLLLGLLWERPWSLRFRIGAAAGLPLLSLPLMLLLSWPGPSLLTATLVMNFYLLFWAPGFWITDAARAVVWEARTDSIDGDAETKGPDPSQSALADIFASSFAKIGWDDLRTLSDGRVVGLAHVKVGRKQATRLFRLTRSGKLDDTFALNSPLPSRVEFMERRNVRLLDVSVQGDVLICQSDVPDFYSQPECRVFDSSGQLVDAIAPANGDVRIERLFLGAQGQLLAVLRTEIELLRVVRIDPDRQARHQTLLDASAFFSIGERDVGKPRLIDVAIIGDDRMILDIRDESPWATQFEPQTGPALVRAEFRKSKGVWSLFKSRVVRNANELFELEPRTLLEISVFSSSRMRMTNPSDERPIELNDRYARALASVNFEAERAWLSRDGSILVSGQPRDGGNPKRPALLKLTSSGEVDPNFHFP